MRGRSERCSAIIAPIYELHGGHLGPIYVYVGLDDNEDCGFPARRERSSSASPLWPPSSIHVRGDRWGWIQADIVMVHRLGKFAPWCLQEPLKCLFTLKL